MALIQARVIARSEFLSEMQPPRRLKKPQAVQTLIGKGSWSRAREMYTSLPLPVCCGEAALRSSFVTRCPFLDRFRSLSTQLGAQRRMLEVREIGGRVGHRRLYPPIRLQLWKLVLARADDSREANMPFPGTGGAYPPRISPYGTRATCGCRIRSSPNRVVLIGPFQSSRPNPPASIGALQSTEQWQLSKLQSLFGPPA
jgi:hypothetical protein